MKALTLYQKIPTFKEPDTETIQNIVRKDNAINQYIHLFPLCFLPFPRQISIFHPSQDKYLFFSHLYFVIVTDKKYEFHFSSTLRTL